MSSSAKYRFRHFFSPGSGVCLWPAASSTELAYGLPTDHWKLPITENLKYKLQHIISWYDTSIDWFYPPDPSPWSPEEREQFVRKSGEVLALLKSELGEKYEILDERKLQQTSQAT
jgi:hypothetical protein